MPTTADTAGHFVCSGCNFTMYRPVFQGFFLILFKKTPPAGVLACYLCAGVDNKVFVDRDEQGWLLTNDDEIQIPIIGSPAQ